MTKSFLSDPNEEIKRDLDGLCKVFQKKFMRMVHPESAVIFNPKFGIGTIMCGGADADAYVDGTLYDFKTSKDAGYKWQDIAQIIGYYFLNDMTYYGREYDLNAPLMGYAIQRIAFYKARYGQIEYFEINKLGQQTIRNTIERLAQYFKKHPANLYSATLSKKLPLDVTPEIFDIPYPFEQ